MMEELPNPFRKNVKPVAPPPPPKASEWTRIYIMAVVLFLVVATMIYMKRTLDAPRKPAAATSGQGGIEYKVGQGGEGAPERQEEEKAPENIQVPPAPPAGQVSFKELAAPFRDGTEKLVKETPEFITLINVFLNSVTRESMTAAVQPGLTAEMAYADSETHRGAVLRCRGRIIQLYTEKLRATNPDGVKHVYLGIVQEETTGRTIFFYTPELPTDPETGEAIRWSEVRVGDNKYLEDWVDLEGVFLRRYLYPSQKKAPDGRPVMAQAAVMFVKNLRKVAPPKSEDPRWPFVMLVGGVAVVIAVIVLVVGVVSRKHSAGSMRMKMYQVRKEKGKGATSGPGKAPLLGDEVPKETPSDKSVPPAKPD